MKRMHLQPCCICLAPGWLDHEILACLLSHSGAPCQRFVLLIQHAETARNCTLVELQKTRGKAGAMPTLLRHIMLERAPIAVMDAFLLIQLLSRPAAN